MLLIVGGVVVYQYLNQPQGEEVEDGDSNLFPFGEILPGVGRGDSTDNQTTEDEEGGEQVTEEEVGDDAGPQLRLINDQPTGGMIPLITTEEREIIVEVENEDGTIQEQQQTITVEEERVWYSNIEDGSVYETVIVGEAPYTENLVVENFIPNAEYSKFSPNGNHVSFQYWDKDSETIETYLGLIELIELDPEPCPYQFETSINVGDEGEAVLMVHQFLNLDPRTQLAESGINSPGNESLLATEATIGAITIFQTLYNLEADGALGPQTRAKMVEVCDQYQEEEAREERAQLESLYEISGFFLPQNIISVNMGPEGEKMFYLQEDPAGTVGTIRNLADNAKEVIFTSPYSEWTSSWKTPDEIQLTTKPSYKSQGYTYELSILNGDFHKSFKERMSLQALPSHDGTKILVYDTAEGSGELSIYNTVEHRFTPLSIETFVDKCVWSQTDDYLYCAVPDSLSYGGAYPDTWYQGLETYRDSLWRINTQTFQEEVLSDMYIEYGEGIDVERIMVDNKDQYLFFIDKNTEYLWSYRIAEV